MHSKFVGHFTEIIRQSKNKGTLTIFRNSVPYRHQSITPIQKLQMITQEVYKKFYKMFMGNFTGSQALQDI